MGGLLCLASLTEHHIFKAHSRCSECQSSTPSYSRIPFYWMIHHIGLPALPLWGLYVVFHSLALINRVSMNISVQVFF